MAKRVRPLDMDRFAALFFALMRDSEERQGPFSSAELLDIGMYGFDNDTAQAEAFRTRFSGLLEVLSTEEAKRYIGGDEEKMVIHPAIIEVASWVRTRHNGSFPKRPFFETVERIVKTYYSDFDLHAAKGAAPDG
jgi:hypothetical protein